MLSVIVDDTRDPAWNLALDEALARVAAVPAPTGPAGAARARPFPVLRVWQNAPSVLVGRFQCLADAVDLACCAHDGVRVARRATGGGAVYTDSGTLLFTLVHRAARQPGTRPDLGALVAAAVAGLGLPAAALGDGIVQSARLRTRHAELTHVAVHVTDLGPYDRSYLAGPPGGRRTLAGLGLQVSLDAVRAAVLGMMIERYGIAATRRPDPRERSLQEHLHARRYGDLTWHLTGTHGPRHPARPRLYSAH
ncbi:lipoate--protein ligase family protein [Actinomadura macrotermitis]|uniref:Lipoate-protein ligase A n=1 Tax=Actinomadura macrotermitis TaxID=2585200 RepID=A0A7K0BSY6_9ACTN|nr:hypothetical protein [Actinomadura macrotermitis]MQY04271.1 Lipoate-protein ligase A [Actinomadura macrotermitis]